MAFARGHRAVCSCDLRGGTGDGERDLAARRAGARVPTHVPRRRSARRQRLLRPCPHRAPFRALPRGNVMERVSTRVRRSTRVSLGLTPRRQSLCRGRSGVPARDRASRRPVRPANFLSAEQSTRRRTMRERRHVPDWHHAHQRRVRLPRRHVPSGNNASPRRRLRRHAHLSAGDTVRRGARLCGSVGVPAAHARRRRPLCAGSRLRRRRAMDRRRVPVGVRDDHALALGRRTTLVRVQRGISRRKRTVHRGERALSGRLALRGLAVRRRHRVPRRLSLSSRTRLHRSAR